MILRMGFIGGVLLLLVAGSALVAAGATYEIRSQVLGGGATNGTGSNFGLRGTVGQSLIGKIATPNYQQGVGFWYTLPRPTDTGVDVPSSDTALRYRLDQNSPNPFNPRTTIHFALSKPGPVTLDVFDLRGRHVTTLVDREMEAGEHRVVFHATELASGVYVCRLQAGEFTQSRQITLIK